MTNLNVGPIASTQIQLFGMTGVFRKPNEAITIHYFSTSASARDPSTGSYALMKELKPMRERVDSTSLTDVEALLQRDLNDRRVAEQLVPYLNGRRPGIAFFPAILAVLVPKGFLSNTSSPVDYPSPTRRPPNQDTDFGSYFRISPVQDTSGNVTPLATLTLNPTMTDVIVIDGQHRASAVRALAGELNDGHDNIYTAFYESIEQIQQMDFDLPVTLIWFEGKTKKPSIDPKSISRRLFIDVNNTARKVSAARTILLDDIEVESIATQQFYTMVAEKNGFSPNAVSLVHSDLDIDSDLSQARKNPLALFSPEIVHSTFSWLFFGSDRYYGNDIYQVLRSRSKRIDRFGTLFTGADLNDSHIGTVEDEDNDTTRAEFNTASARDSFRREYRTLLGPALTIIISDFSLYKWHAVATGRTAEWAATGSTVVREVWSKVFAAGEGLFYALSGIRNPGGRLQSYSQALDEVIDKFQATRSAVSGSRKPGPKKESVEALFGSLRTKAFFAGLILAVDKARRDFYGAKPVGEAMTEAAKWLCGRSNARSHNEWIAAMTDIKKIVVGSEANPRLWPAYQKLILRFLQDDQHEFYGPASVESSPDAKIFLSFVVSSTKAWIEITDRSSINDLVKQNTVPEEHIEWVNAALQKTESTLKAAGLDILDVNTKIWEAMAQRHTLELMIAAVRD